MLKADLGLFKQDSTVKQIKKDNKNEVEFIYYDEDIDEEFLKEKNDSLIKNNKNKKRSNKLYEKIKAQAQKEKSEDKIEIEIDE